MKKELWISTNNKGLEKDAKFRGAVIASVSKEKTTVNGRMIPGIEITSKEDEERAVKLGSRESHIVVSCSDWTIIPLENLISQLHGKTKIIAKVKNAKEAKVALETLELGVDGVLLHTDSQKEFQKLQKVLSEIDSRQIELEEATITKIEPLGVGARTCLDTAELMAQGEGALIGSSSQGMFLVQGEVEQNQFVSPRPFRVNAGALSLYTLTPENKTRYLEEMKAGDQLLIVDRKGRARATFICRSKIELRPMLIIEAKGKGKTTKIILQNAETVRLVTKGGSIAVTDLKGGEKVLVHFEEGGRHFGTLVKEEQIIEK